MSTPSFPIKAKASTQAKIKVILFGIIGLVLAFGAVYLWTADITMGGSETQTGEPMSIPLKVLISAVAALVAFGCFRMLWILIPMLAGKRPAATITERGIESAYVGINLFAFTTLAKVNLIPWAALKHAPAPSNIRSSGATEEVYFRIRASAITPECGSKTVQRALKNMESSTLSITFHMALTPEEAALVRSYMSR
ncbi:MAG: hypothetical protein E7661_10260 [Ruminococcaceae bacterium]|nr:hypothetical protein [Oscillospiraceae bacterium]